MDGDKIEFYIRRIGRTYFICLILSNIINPGALLYWDFVFSAILTYFIILLLNIRDDNREILKQLKELNDTEFDIEAEFDIKDSDKCCKDGGTCACKNPEKPKTFDDF